MQNLISPNRLRLDLTVSRLGKNNCTFIWLDGLDKINRKLSILHVKEQSLILNIA